jgi:hypothetical protein
MISNKILDSIVEVLLMLLYINVFNNNADFVLNLSKNIPVSITVIFGVIPYKLYSKKVVVFWLSLKPEMIYKCNYLKTTTNTIAKHRHSNIIPNASLLKKLKYKVN